MKTLTVFLVFTVLVVQISGYLIKVPTTPMESHIDIGTWDTKWVRLQKLMMPLFENVCEVSSNPMIRRLALEFSMDSKDYLEPQVINNLQKVIANGLLPKGQVFTEYNVHHMNELKVMYEILYKAKDFDAFFKSAAWVRQNVNCGVYINALYMAILNRRDMERLTIPGPYELLPNYFVDKDVVVQASSILAGEVVTSSETMRDEGNTYIIDANYTALFYNNDDDSKLAYYREDIGLNSFYFLRKLRLAPWFNYDINGKYGENTYQFMKQLDARYNLERYANGLPELEGIDWNSLNVNPYDPKLIYSDGNEFGHRTESMTLKENEDIRLLQTIESNLQSVVVHMRQSGYDKSQILNHLMEILVTGDRSYETIARQLLGRDLTNNGRVSVLEHYMTSLRDPIFWKINKKLIDIVDEALKVLPAYTRNELYFPGVEIVNIDVKKMMTAFDYFEFDVTDALNIDESNTTFKVKIGQPRLSRKPFTVKINISSLVSQRGLLKLYLGPKLMPGELALKKNLFTLIDVFEVPLKIGTNIISRSSNDMKHFSEDFLLLDTIRKNVEDAAFGLYSMPLNTIQEQTGYPSRLILPKGTPEGLPLQIFAFIAPYFKTSLGESYSTNSMQFNSAIMSPGYPLDLIMNDGQLFNLPNALIKYITLTQKSDTRVENYGGPGIAKSWYIVEEYDPSTRPYYNPRKGPYGGDNDYSVKPTECNVPTNYVIPENVNQDHDYNVIGLNNVIRPLLKSPYDYASKQNKEPFDYKAKKAQFGKKDYTGSKDYSKYRAGTKYEDVDVTATPTITTVPIATKPLDNYAINQNNMEFATISEVHPIVLLGDEILPKAKEESLEIEPLPLPAMLKTDLEKPEKFDYKLKKKERDAMVKAKRIELDGLIKDAKNIHRLLRPVDEGSKEPLKVKMGFINPIDIAKLYPDVEVTSQEDWVDVSKQEGFTDEVPIKLFDVLKEGYNPTVYNYIKSVQDYEN